MYTSVLALPRPTYLLIHDLGIKEATYIFHWGLVPPMNVAATLGQGGGWVCTVLFRERKKQRNGKGVWVANLDPKL